jgi:hypothetical protein
MYRKSMKLLHELGAVGLLGSLAACLVLVATAPTDSLAGYAAVRQGVAEITKWLLVPSLAITMISGLGAIAGSDAYINAGWPWLKALLGVAMFEGTLLTVAASARRAAELSAQAVQGAGDPALLAAAIRTEWGGLWMMIALSLANVVIAVWRPRSRRRAMTA